MDRTAHSCSPVTWRERAADGSLFVTGRSDSQVKVRGHRLHLEEVEAAIVRHPEVKDARVVPRTHSNGDVTLSAFVVGRPDAALDGPAVQRSLREILPGYSVPTTFVVVDSLPLTAHGKVDRDALLRLVPAPAIPGSPDSEIEEVLADLWRDAFDRDDVDVEQPFLTAGGDSLAATVIAAGIHDIFGIELGLGVFAGDPTVSELARLINDQRATGVVTVLHEIEKVPRRGSHPLSCLAARNLDQGVRGSELAGAGVAVRHPGRSGRHRVQREHRGHHATP